MAASTEEEKKPLLPVSSDGGASAREAKQSTPSDEPPPEAVAVAGLLTLVLFILGCIYIKRHFFPRLFGPFDPVEYTIAIAAVSGLDPVADLTAQPPALLDPAFNLTLRVSSPSTAYDRECVKAGTTVEVSYLRSRVPLATGPAPALCVGVGEQREEGSVIAWGDGVRLPGFVLDSLAADMRHGRTEFGVKLVGPLPFCGGDSTYWSSTVRVVSCWAKMGGGPAPCNVTFETVSLPVPRSGRDSGSLPQPTQ